MMMYIYFKLYTLLGTYYTRYVICENYSLKLFFCPLLLKFGICCFVTDLCCNFLNKKDSSFNLWFDISLPICLLHFFLTDLICGLKYDWYAIYSRNCISFHWSKPCFTVVFYSRFMRGCVIHITLGAAFPMLVYTLRHSSWRSCSCLSYLFSAFVDFVQ